VLVTRKQQKFLAFGSVAQPGEQAFRKETLRLRMDWARSWSRRQPVGRQCIYLFRRERSTSRGATGWQPLAEDQGTMPIVYQARPQGPQSSSPDQLPDAGNDILYVSPAPLSEARASSRSCRRDPDGRHPRTLLGNYRAATDATAPRLGRILGGMMPTCSPVEANEVAR